MKKYTSTLPFLYLVLLMCAAIGIFFFFFLRESQLSEGKDLIFIKDENSVIRSMNKGLENRLVAHALGGLAGGVIYSNSLESFLASHRSGFRFFEVDLSLTSDDIIVAFHDGLEKYIGLKQKIRKTKHKEFMSKKYLGRFTLLDSDGLLALLELYPDAYFIIDVKTNYRNLWEFFMKRIQIKNPALLSRIIPQAYSQGDLEYIRSIHDFDDVFFSLYEHEGINDIAVLRLAKKYMVSAVVMSRNRYSPQLKKQLEEMNIASFVHTVNGGSEIEKYLQNGIGVYTDYYSFPLQ